MKSHGTKAIRERPIFSEFVEDFAALEHIAPPSAHTVLLIVADASDVSVETISRVAKWLLASGLIYVCAWGPDCERVHDIFDETYVGDGTIVPSFTFMSSWHSDEPLEEALWFFLQCASTLGAEMESASYLAVTVGRRDWEATVDDALSNRDAFVARMLEDEPRSDEDT